VHGRPKARWRETRAVVDGDRIIRKPVLANCDASARSVICERHRRSNAYWWRHRDQGCKVLEGVANEAPFRHHDRITTPITS
jgi:hypothetical protein